MLQAIRENVIIQKVKKDSNIKGIYMNDNNYEYQIKDIRDNQYGLQTGDKIIVKEENVIWVKNDNQELGIININDILAIIK